MKKLFGILALSGAINVYAQTAIKIAELSNHVGDSIKLTTKIYGGKFLSQSPGTPSLLNAGAKYPDAPLTIVIFGENRAAFKNKPEEFYLDKNICVTGRIAIYRGKPEIIISDEKQILVRE